MIMVMEKAPAILRKLYERYKKTHRGGYEALAKKMGRGHASSIQRYFEDDWSKKSHFPPELVADFEKVFAGHGEPRITKEEVWKMATPHPVSLPENKEINAADFNDVGHLWNLYKAAPPDIQEEFDTLHAAHLKKKARDPDKKGDRAA